MAINIAFKQLPEFDIRKDPKTIYTHFVKYAKQFNSKHLKAYNITDKALRHIFKLWHEHGQGQPPSSEVFWKGVL